MAYVDHLFVASRNITDDTLSGRCECEIPTCRSPRVLNSWRSTDRHRIQQRSRLAPNRKLCYWKEITMLNPYLFPNIPEYIIDLLHNEQKHSVIVAWSQIMGPWARKHLLSDIRFSSPSNLTPWEQIFQHPTRSPAYYAHILFIACLQAIEDADMEEGS